MQHYTLHAKNLPFRLQVTKALGLATTPEIIENMEYEMQWLSNIDRYAAVPVKSCHGTPEGRLTSSFVNILVNCGLIERVEPAAVRGHVRIFLHPEHAKKRFRPIRFTKDINTFCGRDTLRPCVIPSKADIVPSVLKGKCMILLDLAAMFDQFELSDDVGHLMCFRQGEHYYRLKVMAMGQRQAVGVATAAMKCLLDFPKRSTHCDSIIDNVRFLGDTPEDVIHDAKIFIRRCADVGATLNEIDAPNATDEQIAALVTTADSWGRVHLNLVSKEVSITAKSVQKTKDSWAIRSTWTNREYAGHIGLLFWAWRILELPMAEFFPVLRFNSELAKYITTFQPPQRDDGSYPSNPAWDDLAVIWPGIWTALERWTSLVIANTPRVVRPDAPPEVVMQCDASRWGCGYVSVNVATGEVHCYAEKWDSYMEENFGDRLGQSTFSEPIGLFKCVRHRFNISPDLRSIDVGTDNTPTMFSNERGFSSRSFHINDCIAKRERMFPSSRGYSVSTHSVKGIRNLSDGLSRGHEDTISDETARKIREYADEMLRSRRGRTLAATMPIVSVDLPCAPF